MLIWSRATIRDQKYIYPPQPRVLLPKIDFLIPEAFRVVCADETEVPDVEVLSTYGRVQVNWIAVLPVPGNLESWLIFGRSGCRVTIPDARFETTIFTTRCNGWGPIFPLKGFGSLWMYV